MCVIWYGVASAKGVLRCRMCIIRSSSSKGVCSLVVKYMRYAGYIYSICMYEWTRVRVLNDVIYAVKSVRVSHNCQPLVKHKLPTETIVTVAVKYFHWLTSPTSHAYYSPRLTVGYNEIIYRSPEFISLNISKK